MAENPTGLTTEQLLMELGKVVMGLGRKIETMGEKMDAIHSVLAEDIAPALKVDEPKEAGEAAVMDITPLLEKLDELKAVFDKQIPDQGSADSPLADVMSEKLQAIENVLSGEILPAIKNMKSSEDSVQVDFAPLVEKIDAVSAAIGEAGVMEELKPLLEGLSASLEQLPSKMTDRLKELKDADSSDPMETVEKKLIEVCNKLEEILKVSEDREYIEALSQGISTVKEQLVLSGDLLLSRRKPEEKHI